MYLDTHNPNATKLINTFDQFYPTNNTVQWKNVLLNQTVESKTDKDDLSIKFVLKNDPNKIKRPIKVFTIPIVDKVSPTQKPTQTTAPKKSLGSIEEEHSVEYEYDDDGGYGGHDAHKYGMSHHSHNSHKIKPNKNNKYSSFNKNKNKNGPMRGCKSKRRVSHKLKKMGKYVIPAGIGFLTFKLILLPLLLKVLAVMSAKGLFLGMVSFIMASLLSLKQIVGSTGRHSKKSDITLIPIPLYSGKHHHRKKDETYLEYDHNPYGFYYNEEPK